MTLTDTPQRAGQPTGAPHRSDVEGADADDVPATVRVERSTASAAEWDAFAQRCDASFRCSYRGTQMWQYESHWLHRLHRLDLYRVAPGGDRKVGQCAVGVGRRQSVFSDGVQLLPGEGALWTAAITSVLDRLGPATYVYGSPWSLEVPREAALGGLPRVTVDHVAATSLDVIDFERWGSFDVYLRSVSQNVRRNIKKARATYPDLAIAGGGGIAGVRRYFGALALRRAMFRRKGVERATSLMALRSAARLFALGRHCRLAYLVNGDDLLAYHMGIAFGRDWSYMEGASRSDAVGASWHLLVTVIERAYAQSQGRGRFIMGSDDGTQAGVEAWEGLRRSRRQCCATSFPTSVVRFTYAPAQPHVRAATPRA
jgi:hypothetical protein